MTTNPSSTKNEFLELRHLLQCDNHSCGKMNPLQRCARCQCVYYCSVKCQQVHWKTGHKMDCKDTEALRKVDIADTALPKKVAIAKTAVCGLCHKDAMRFPIALPNCGHTFCFKCISTHQGHGGILLNRGCPSCGTSVDKHVIQDAILKTDVYLNHRDFTLDDDDVEGRNEMHLLANGELDHIFDVDSTDRKGRFMLAKILEYTDPHEAIAIYQEHLTYMRSLAVGSFNTAGMTEAIAEAVRIGNADLARQIMKTAQSFSQDESETQQLWPAQIGLARSYMAAGLHNKAMVEYEKVYGWMNPQAGTVVTGDHCHFLRQVMHGMSRCHYILGDYEKAFLLAANFSCNVRLDAGAHKLVAMALHAMSKQPGKAGLTVKATEATTRKTTLYKLTLEGAIEVMYKGFAYEEPWYEKNMRSNRAFLQELLDMKAAASPNDSIAAVETAIPSPEPKTKARGKKGRNSK